MLNHAKEIAQEIRKMNEWNMELCAELCELADMSEEWENSNSETFENVLYTAAEKLGVEI